MANQLNEAMLHSTGTLQILPAQVKYLLMYSRLLGMLDVGDFPIVRRTWRSHYYKLNGT